MGVCADAGRTTGPQARLRTWRASLLTALLLVSAACRPATAPSTTPVAARERPVRLLLVNDVYASDTLRDGSGSLARVAAWRDSVEQTSGERVLFLLAGDLFSPSLLSKWYFGAQMVEALKSKLL